MFPTTQGVPGLRDGLDAAPPNPVTDPRAAAESSPTRTLTGGAIPPASGMAGSPGGGGPSPMGMAGQGPDLTGLLALYQKVTEGMLALAQACPAQAGKIDMARSVLDNAAADFVQSQSGVSTGLPGGGATPPPGIASQAGSQYPGGGFVAGRAF